MDQWKDKIAVVTGASSGIGRAVALGLLRSGMRVAVCARRAEKIETIGKEAGCPERFFPKRADLRHDEELKLFFADVMNHWGPIHVLINNAGLGYAGALDSQPVHQWREMLELNVVALSHCTQLALSQMSEHGEESHIIHLGSMSGHRVPAGSNGMYAASKFAVRALTESLRQEIHQATRPIRVSSISPGLVETGFAEHYSGSTEAADKTYGAMHCLQSVDIAGAVLYALSQPSHVQVHDILIRPKDQAL